MGMPWTVCRSKTKHKSVPLYHNPRAYSAGQIPGCHTTSVACSDWRFNDSVGFCLRTSGPRKYRLYPVCVGADRACCQKLHTSVARMGRSLPQGAGGLLRRRCRLESRAGARRNEREGVIGGIIIINQLESTYKSRA
jgi:hypothetical protein